MTHLELLCLAIVVVYVALRLARGGGAAFVQRFVLLAIAGAISEDTLIRAYGYYGYSTSWSIAIDRVPLVVVLVWPVVVDSAAVLARAIVGERATALRTAALSSTIVLGDAALIEPVAVRAGLWRWTEPGVFGVPLVGIAGWAIFALVATLLLEQMRASVRAAILVIAPIATHAAILASWWTLFRFTEKPLPEIAAVLVAWALAIGAATRTASVRLTMHALLMRAPGAIFFFVLLAQTIAAPSSFAEPWPASWSVPPAAAALLVVYAVAFALPYLAALAANVSVRAARNETRSR